MALQGAMGKAGSAVTRHLGDGSRTVYPCDAENRRYMTTNGPDAHDIITYDVIGWIWTDGVLTEGYGGTTGQLQFRDDAYGNRQRFEYISSAAGARLARVIDNRSQQRLELVVDSKERLSRLATLLVSGLRGMKRGARMMMRAVARTALPTLSTGTAQGNLPQDRTWRCGLHTAQKNQERRGERTTWE